MDAHLAEVESQAEQDGVDSIAEAAADNENFWIGLTDIGKDDDFIWMHSKNKMVFHNWGGEDPDGGLSQECVMMFGQANFGFHWADIDCESFRAHPLCEANDYP